jgi:hypothetical protein
MTDFAAKKLRVFVVWEPILPTDWQAPTSVVLGRVTDVRASQYWDKDHLVAKLIRQHVPGNEPDCCAKDGILWDVVVLYPKGAPLSTRPSFIAGPVVNAAANAKTRVAGM